MKSKRLDSFDFFRGLATIIVFLTHFGFFSLNGVAVDLFFILSGYLIAKSLLEDTSRKPYLKYIIKRSTKIFPSYYFFLIFGFLFSRAFISPITPENVPALSEWKEYFFFYRNYGGPPPRWAFDHLWSLCAEEHFYVLFLSFTFILKRYDKYNYNTFFKLIVCVILLGISFKLQALITDFAEWGSYTHNRIDVFGWGILIYLMTKKEQFNTFFNNKILFISGVILLVITLIVDTHPNLLITRISAPISLCLILIGLFNYRFPYIHFFRKISYYSYSIYLWHYVFLIPIHHYFNGIWSFIAYLTATLALALCTTHFIERPSVKARPLLYARFKIEG